MDILLIMHLFLQLGEVKIDPVFIEQQGTSETLFYPEAGARFPGLVGQTIVLGV